MAFSADHSLLATAGKDGIARIWRTDGQFLHELSGHEGPLTDVAFSPNGGLIATSSEDKTARIWDASNGRYLRTLPLKKPVMSVTFSPDSRFVLTAGADDKAHLWRARTGGSLAALSWHFTPVADAEFSPDGGWIVTIGLQSAQIWQPHLPDPLFLFSSGIGGPSGLTSAVFDPTSRTVLVASKDGTVRTYYCALCGGLDELLPLARARLALTGRKLTAAERRQYGG
jgi:WD40 repeat protein